MCENTEIADKAIQELISDLTGQYGRMLSDDDKIIDRIAKLRASMNPTIIQKN